MWFNLKKIKEIVFYFQKINYARFFLLIPIDKKLWTNTLYFKKLEFLSKKFSYKNKQLLSDHNNYFFFLEKKNKFFNTFGNYNNVSFFFCFILLFNSIDFLIVNKYKYTFLKNKFLKKKYVLLLKKKKVYFVSEFIQLNNIFLIFKLFYIYDKILLNFELYVYFAELFFFDLKNFINYLKRYFLKRCPLRVKIQIWDQCKFPVDRKKVFYRAESRWIIRQREIFEEHNKGFFDSIDYDVIFFLWVINKLNPDQKTRLHRYHKYLYYKSEFINNKIKYLKYKLNHLNKKKYISNFYLFIINNLNFNKYYNKIYIRKLLKNLPLFFNRLKLLHLIFFRKKKIKDFLKKKSLLKGLFVLNLKKKKIMYICFFIFFLKYFKRYYILNDSIFENLYLKFKKIKKINKLIFRTFKLLFWLYYKFQVDYYYDDIGINKNFKIFIFSFLFFCVEKKLFNNKTSVQNYTNLDKNFLFKDYYLNSVDVYLFYYLWKILAVNYATEFDDFFTKRHKLLNIVLFSNYKKYWLKYNLKFFKIFNKYENILITKLRSLNFFFINESILHKLYNHYYLFSFSFFNFSQYKNLLKNKFFLIKKLIIKKKKKQNKKNKYKNLNKKYFNLFIRNKNLKTSIFFLFCFFLFKQIKILKFKIKKKINFLKRRYTRLNLNIIVKKKIILQLLNILKSKYLIKIFKNYFIYLKNNKKISYNKNIPFFFKTNFGIIKAFYFFLEKDRVQLISLHFEIIILKLMLFYFLNKLKNKIKYNYLFSCNNLKVKMFLFLLKNKLKRKKNKIFFKKFNITLNSNFIISTQMQNYLYTINNLNKYIKKFLYLINSLNFFLIIKDNLLNHFFFFFQESLVKDMVLNVSDNLLCWRSFFDFKIDKIILNYGKYYKKNFVKTGILIKFSKYFFKYFTIFWLVLKRKIYLENLKIFINKKLIFILWYDVFNSEKKIYTDLPLDDYLFKYNIKYFRFYLNIYKKNIIYFTPEVKFFIQILIHHLNFLKQKSLELIKLTNLNYKLWVQSYHLNQNYLKAFTYYLKFFFFKLITLQYRKKKVNKIIHYNNFLEFNNNYYLKKKKFFLQIKEETLTLNKDLIVCNKCSFLYTDINLVNLIKYYQSLFNFTKLNKNILTFNYSFCKVCSSYKLNINNQPIKYFSSYNSILKYFILNSYVQNYIFFQNKIYLCSLKKIKNYIFFEEVKFINLICSKYKLKGLYFFLLTQDRLYFNIFLKFENLEIFSFYYYYFFLIEFIYFFELNNFYLTPTLVKKLDRLNFMLSLADYYQEIKLYIKWYRKKYKMKLTKKMRKETKLELLNKFFEDFKKG